MKKPIPKTLRPDDRKGMGMTDRWRWYLSLFGDHFAGVNSHVFKLTTKVISTDELAKNCSC